MARSLWLALALVFFVPAMSFAQAPAHADTETLSLDPAYAAELASIDTESQVATGLYITAVTLHVGGLAVGVIGGIAGFCLYSCSDGARTAQAWSAAGLVVSAVGLLAFIPAIILDVESGQRRARLQQRGHVAFSIGAGGVGLEGSF